MILELSLKASVEISTKKKVTIAQFLMVNVYVALNEDDKILIVYLRKLEYLMSLFKFIIYLNVEFIFIVVIMLS